VNYFKRSADPNAAGELEPMAAVNIVMTTAKALGILGFPSFQSLDQTEYEQVCSAFLNKLMTVMKNRKQAMMKAQEDRNKPKSQNQIQSRLRREKSWRVDVVMINEAFQHLTRKKTRTEFATKTWKTSSHNNSLMSQTMDCFQLDEAVTDKNRDEKEKIREKKRANSKQAQALALTLASRIDTLAEKTEKPKHQNGTKTRSKSTNDATIDNPKNLEQEDILDFIDQWLEDQNESTEITKTVAFNLEEPETEQAEESKP